jgi:hypothetical protein
MRVQHAKTFSEYVDLLATNSPHATVLDWWRRLEMAAQVRFESVHGARFRRAVEAERLIARLDYLGPEAASTYRRMRLVRNEVSHAERCPLTREEAILFAQEAFRLMGALLYERSWAEAPLLPVGPRADSASL